MPVQIVITGEHATDAIAELQNLATALGGPVQHEVSVTLPAKAEAPADAPKAEAPKVAPKEEKLSRTEQEKAMKEMIEAGEKDERFDLLTSGRQNKVTKALDAAEEADSKDEAKDDFDDMFDDDDDASEEITGDHIRQMMAEKGKDADGNPIQDNLLKIREILTKHVPKGEEVKVGKIPADKLAAAYAELKAL